MINTKTIVAAGLVAFSNAHMLISSPQAFASPAIAQSPLTPDNFPCQRKLGEAFAAGGNMNQFELGSKQTLKWIGTAVHGGGSCQISISYDTNPTPQSVWKVIHSIEGGCPARNTVGNREPASASAPNPDTYDYTIPDNIPTGKATISVSWLNRRGNREFYMYCGAVELTGKGGDKANYESLPDIYVANLPGINTCTTPDDAVNGEMDWKFPNPGASVENNLGKFGTFPLASGCGKFSGAAGSGSGSAPGSGSGSGPSYPSAPASKPAPSAPGGVFLTKQPDAAPTQAPTSAPVAPAPSSAPAAPAPGAGSGSGSGSGPGSSGALTGKCTEGQWNCVGGSSFQQCGSGTWSPVMAMAPGTKCTAGQSTELKVAAAKRVVRVFRA
ncbi:endoglucanase [Apiospora rasikravindrae]|uniref:Endoglucanase n=1 Tax=Apiospora rasikravindrae TaxID=990691 RepID=A0ABR1SM69_9PEZI